MRKRKSSSGDTTPIHPYIAEYISQSEITTERARLREGWKTWGNVKKVNGNVVSFNIITKNI